jgi:hypothetical protein
MKKLKTQSREPDSQLDKGAEFKLLKANRSRPGPIAPFHVTRYSPFCKALTEKLNASLNATLTKSLPPSTLDLHEQVPVWRPQSPRTRK